MERNLDFDTVINRRGTNSLKYDAARRRGKPEDILPLWVADMDFRTSSYIENAVTRAARHGIFGYSEPSEAYYDALGAWMSNHFGWQVAAGEVVLTPGVVFALAMAVKAYTKPGDAVLIQRPVYYPFARVIEDNGRRIIDNTLVADETGYYRMNLSDFEDKIVREQVKLFFLCNPHNPVGRAWTREELISVGDICKAHGVIVVSDEIHADFVYSARHEVFANVKEEYGAFTVTCTSPSKTFNIAGLQISNIVIPDDMLKKKLIRAIDGAGYSQVGTVGIIACQAAYEHGEEWYRMMRTYVRANITYLKDYLDTHLPMIHMCVPEATYLIWLDFRALGLDEAQTDDFLEHDARLWLDGGGIFGSAGRGFQRINVACPRATLTKALDRLTSAVNRKFPDQHRNPDQH